MIIKKGTKLKILHSHKGAFTAIAEEDFDTDKDERYPVRITKSAIGMNTVWKPGDHISCFACRCLITILEE